MTRLPRRTLAGFNLVEVMVSLAILAIALVSLIASQNDAIQVAQVADTTRRSHILLLQQVGVILGDPRLDEGSYSGDFENVPGASWSASVVEVEVPSTGDAEKGRDPLLILHVVLRVTYPDAMDSEMIIETYRLTGSDMVALWIR